MEQVAKEGDEWGRREREGRNGDTSSVSLVYNVYSSISLVRSNNLNATAGFARRVVVPYNTNDIHLLMRGDPPGKSTKLNTIQISPRSSCELRADSGFTQRGGEECGLWRHNDGNFWRVGGIGPENLTVGGVVRPEQELRSVYLCIVEHHPEARNERAFVERTLGLVSTDGSDMILGDVGGER